VKRLLALLAAAAMVTGSLWLRGRLDEGGTGTGEGTGGRSTPGVTVACVSELAPVCAAVAGTDPRVEVRIEEAAVTEAELARTETRPGIDAWLTFAPFAAIVSEERQRAGRFPVLDEPTGPLAWSPLTIVVWKDRESVLSSRCGAEITWRCVGEVGGSPWADLGGPATWGPVKPGHPTPETTAVGLLVLGQAAGSYFGSPGYASNDFTDPAFRTWFERLERSVPSFPPPPRTPLDEMLSKGPATFDLAGSTEAAAVPAVGRSRDRDRLSVLYPSPRATAEVVLVPVAGSDAGGRVEKLFTSDEASAAFTGAGWLVDPATRPVDDGLPRPGVLQALRSLWVEVVR
jgi:hypothetical protein